MTLADRVCDELQITDPGQRALVGEWAVRVHHYYAGTAHLRPPYRGGLADELWKAFGPRLMEVRELLRTRTRESLQCN